MRWGVLEDKLLGLPCRVSATNTPQFEKCSQDGKIGPWEKEPGKALVAFFEKLWGISLNDAIGIVSGKQIP